MHGVPAAAHLQVGPQNEYGCRQHTSAGSSPWNSVSLAPSREAGHKHALKMSHGQGSCTSDSSSRIPQQDTAISQQTGNSRRCRRRVGSVAGVTWFVLGVPCRHPSNETACKTVQKQQDLSGSTAERRGEGQLLLLPQSSSACQAACLLAPGHSLLLCAASVLFGSVAILLSASARPGCRW